MPDSFPRRLPSIMLHALLSGSPRHLDEVIPAWRDEARSAWAGIKIYARGGGKTGIASGHVKPCTLEGCNGTRIMVRWPNGRRTWPCSEGLQKREDGYEIM